MEQQQQPSSSSATTTSSSSPSSSQRRELQGPRPAALKVGKDSHKIGRKPPTVVQQVRQPVIIYTVSPKVVHAEPSEFMSVVQRLTGATAASSSSSVPATTEPHHQTIQMTSSPPLPFPFPLFAGGHHHHQVHAPSSSSSSTQLHFPFQLPQHQQSAAAAGGAPHPQDHLMTGGQLSPAARLAAIEQASRSSGTTAAAPDVVGLPPFPSILSPAGALPAIPPSFFSPLPGNNSGGGISSLFSPAFLGAANNNETGGGSIVAGASRQSVTMLSPSVTPSPSPSPYGAYYWDLFNNQHRN